MKTALLVLSTTVLIGSNLALAQLRSVPKPVQRASTTETSTRAQDLLKAINAGENVSWSEVRGLVLDASVDVAQRRQLAKRLVKAGSSELLPLLQTIVAGERGPEGRVSNDRLDLTQSIWRETRKLKNDDVAVFEQIANILSAGGPVSFDVQSEMVDQLCRQRSEPAWTSQMAMAFIRSNSVGDDRQSLQLGQLLAADDVAAVRTMLLETSGSSKNPRILYAAVLAGAGGPSNAEAIRTVYQQAQARSTSPTPAEQNINRIRDLEGNVLERLATSHDDAAGLLDIATDQSSAYQMQFREWALERAIQLGADHEQVRSRVLAYRSACSEKIRQKIKADTSPNSAKPELLLRSGLAVMCGPIEAIAQKHGILTETVNIPTEGLGE